MFQGRVDARAVTGAVGPDHIDRWAPFSDSPLRGTQIHDLSDTTGHPLLSSQDGLLRFEILLGRKLLAPSR